MKKSKIMALDSINERDYVVIRSNGELHITVIVEKEPNFIDAICTIVSKRDLNNLLDGGELVVSKIKKISFAEVGENMKIEAAEEEKILSILIAKKELGALHVFF